MLSASSNIRMGLEQTPRIGYAVQKFSYIRFWFLLSFLIFCLFDAHIQTLLHLDNFILAECIEIAMLGYLLLRVITRKKIKPLLLGSILLMLLIIIAGTFKNGFFVSLVGTFFLFKSIIAFQCGYVIKPTLKEIYKLFNFILFIACVSGFVSILQYFIHNSFINNPFGFPIVKASIEDRGKGIFSHPNRNGQVLLYGGILSLYFFKSSKDQWKRYLCFLLIIGGMIGSGSRQSLLGFAIILIVHFFILNKASKKIINFFALSTFFLVFVYSFGQDFIQQRFSKIGSAVETGDYFRLQATINSFEILRDYPVFGVGAGLWGGTVAEKYGSPYYKTYDTFQGYLRKTSMDIDTYWPHAWAELGIVGFLMYLLVLFFIIRRLFKLRKTLGDIPKILLLMLVATIFVSAFSLEIEAAFINLIAFMLAGSIINKFKEYQNEVA